MLSHLNGSCKVIEMSSLIQFFYSTAFESRLAVAIVRVAGGLDFGVLSSETAATSSLTGTSSGSVDELRVRRAPLMLHADSDLDIRGAEHPPRHNLSSTLPIDDSKYYTPMGWWWY